jgi:uncharacterized protein (DUF1499 family)
VLKTVALGFISVLALPVVAAIVYLAVLGVQSRNMTVSLGVVDGRLRDCPPTPNCVSSDVDPGDSHYISPIIDASGDKWASIEPTVGALPGAQLVASSDDYAYFTFTSRLFGFVDDVEFHYRPDVDQIAVRSASRVGQGDLNANRKRIETIRAALR